MDFKKLKAVYFIGIGGIGMSALARYFNAAGIFTAGYDRFESPLAKTLTEEGIKIHYDDNIALIPNTFIHSPQERVLIVCTPAIPENNTELVFFRARKYTIKKRSEVLGEICNQHKTIAVAGTHGKTTVSTILTHIFSTAEKKANAFLGGISKNLNSNLLLSDHPQSVEFAIAEADEFDRSFLQLRPHTAIITSIDADHLDIYGDAAELRRTFYQFIKQIDKAGTLIVKENTLDKTPKSPKQIYTYGFSKTSDFQIVNLKSKERNSTFDLITPFGKIKQLDFYAPGKINAENAMAAAAASLISGISHESLRKALRTYKGVKRRFEYIIQTNDTIIIDDYAHHPTELEAFITSVKKIYPAKKLCGVFQPHLYSRTRDFADGFAQSLDLLDKVHILPIYPAREKPIPGITSELLISKMKNENGEVIKHLTTEKAQKILNYDIILVMGAGEMFTIIEKLEKILKKRNL